MNLNEYQELASRTASGNLGMNSEIANFAMGLTGEAGEVCDYLKKVLFHGHDLDCDIVKKELGDVLWYASQLARVCGLTLDEIAVANIEKLKARYPQGFSSADSIKRVDEQ